jgi:hypothetical protein
MTQPVNLTVGQKLFLRYEYYRGDSLTETTVQSIGRKFVNLAGGSRLFKGTLDLDGSNGIGGHAYLSREAFVEHEAVKAAWTAFLDKIRYTSLPEDLTVEKIRQAREILGLP